MNRVHFAVVSEAGDILRTGTCIDEDAALQGDLVVVSAEDLGVSGATHRFDPATGKFEVLEGGQDGPD